jgi:putative peptide maturation system protein
MESSIAICAIAEYVRSVTLRQSSDEDARAELSALTKSKPWTSLRARVVSSCEEYDSSRHFDVLLTDADGTYTVSFAPADGLPWPLRGVHRWSEGDLVRVNGTTLRIQQAVACLDFVWERDDLLEHLVNVCLVEEELAIRDPFAVSDAELQVRLDEFRRAKGLFAAADTHEWLARHGISHRRLECRLADALRVELLAEQVVGHAIADYLKAHKSELGIFPVMLASARSLDDLQDLRRQTADPASWLMWAMTPGGNGRQVQCYRADAFDTSPPLASLASADVPAGAVSQVFLKGDVHALACKLGPTEPPEPGPELTRQVRDRLFADWLAERRQHADVEWYWGSRNIPPSPSNRADSQVSSSPPNRLP